MNTNVPAIADIYGRLLALVNDLAAIDAEKIESANLVPMAKAIETIAAYNAAIAAQINARAVANNELIPGVTTKTTTTHRRWHDEEAAGQLAQEALGDKAFKRSLLSPAQIEKMGDTGKNLVAVASYKPEGTKVAVY